MISAEPHYTCRLEMERARSRMKRALSAIRLLVLQLAGCQSRQLLRHNSVRSKSTPVEVQSLLTGGSRACQARWAACYGNRLHLGPRKQPRFDLWVFLISALVWLPLTEMAPSGC